VITIHQR